MIDDFGDFPETSSDGTMTPETPIMADIYWMRQSTAPTKISQRVIPSATRRRSPSNSAPTILTKKLDAKQHRRKNSKKAEILKINHIPSEETDQSTNLPGTVISNSNSLSLNMAVKTNSIVNSVKNHVPPNSKSDGDLLAVSKGQNNHIPNSHSETYLKNNEQCCAPGFGTSNGKPAFNSNNCVLI